MTNNCLLRSLFLVILSLFVFQNIHGGEIKVTPVHPQNGQMILEWDPGPIQIKVENFNDQFNVNDLSAFLYFFRDEALIYSNSFNLEPSTLTPGQSHIYTLGDIPYNDLGLGDFQMMVEIFSPDNIEQVLNIFTIDFSIVAQCDSDPTINTIVPPNGGCLEHDQEGDLQIMMTNIGHCETKNLKLNVEYSYDSLIVTKEHAISDLEAAASRTESIPIPVSELQRGMPYDINITINADNDVNPENNFAASIITIKSPVINARISGISTPECTNYDSPFNVDVMIENNGKFSIDQLRVDLNFTNTSRSGIDFNVAGTFADLPVGNTIELSFPIDQHLDKIDWSGHYDINGNLTIQDDANPDDNVFNTSTKIILTRPAIQHIVMDKIPITPDEKYAMTYLSSNPFPEGTLFRPYGKPDVVFTAPFPVYMAYKDIDELAMLEHPFHYCFVDEFGFVHSPLETGTPLLINGELDNYDPFQNEFYIDGTPVEKEIEESPGEYVTNDGSGTGPTIDSVACVILVSGEKKEYTDIAFENDVDLLEQQFMTEMKGHRFRQDQIIKLKRPTPEQLDSLFNAIKNASVSNKTIYFIYTGHGLLENGGSIVLQSDDLDEEFSTYSYERLAMGLKSTGVSSHRVIIDACYSGLAVDKFSDAFFDPSKTNQRLSLFTSSKDSIKASSVRLKVDGERRFYSQYLFRWMQGYGAYDPNMDGLSSFEECHLYTTFSTSLKSENTDDEQSLWREQQPWSYKNGNELIAEDDVEKRLGDTKINVIRRIQGFNRYDGHSNRTVDDAIIQYSEINGLPGEFPLGAGVEEIIDYRYWILALIESDDSSSFDISIQPEVDFMIEHNLGEIRNLGLVRLVDGIWEAIPSLYDPETGEVIIKDFRAFGTIAFAYTDQSETTGIYGQGTPLLTIQTFPNPFSNNINISMVENDFEISYLNIYALNGRRVKHEIIQRSGEIISIDSNSLAPGIYLLVIVSEGKILGSSRIIKQ